MKQADYANESRDVACDVALCERMWYNYRQLNNVLPPRCEAFAGHIGAQKQPEARLHSSLKGKCNVITISCCHFDGKPSNKPLLLDCFCGASGAGHGYHLAGFHVVGCDIQPQPHNPHEFYQDDALAVLDQLLDGKTWNGYQLSDFSAIHASPPCQRYTAMSNNNKAAQAKHPDLIAPTRERLIKTRLPYIIENVVGAKSLLINPIMLCGAMFDLRVYRHRLFESNVFLFAPSHIKHQAPAAKASRIPRNGEFWSPVGCFGQKDDAQRAMGITWMATTGSRDKEIAEAIPPAYTRYIGMQLMTVIATSQEVAR